MSGRWDYPSSLIIFWIFLHKGFCQSVQQQSFRVRPTDVAVAAGQDVTLRCEVNNQRGQAQWTQNGFAFGFDRTIPGVSRFSMMGNEAEGVHNLRIRNITMDEDGEYQCQVTPMLPSHAIRASAKVTVLVPPSSIVMVGHERREAEVTVKAGDQVTLECLAKNAKPAPQIAWYRGSQRLRIEQEDQEEASEVEKLKNTRSKITLTPANLDNNVIYTCRTSHPALRQADELSASVKLDVQYEPGHPEITGYIEGQFLRANEVKTMTCRSRGGNPLPEVFWYKNGEQIDTTFNKHHSFTVNDYEFTVQPSDNNAKYECHVQNVMTPQPKKSEVVTRVHFSPTVVKISGPDQVNVGDNISLSCLALNSNPPADVSLLINGHPPPGVTFTRTKTPEGGFSTIANLTGYVIAPTDTDLTVNCYAANQPLGTTKLDTKIIIVLRPPSPPVIIGYKLDTVLRSDEKQRLTCRSTGGNPLPDLKWFKGGKELTSTTIKESGSSVSHLDIVLDMTDNGAEYRCEASNSATATPLVNSTILTVMYPPSGVKLEVKPLTPKSGEGALLTCITAPAFPRANVSWWRDGFEVEGTYGGESPGPHRGIITSYSINITVTDNLNKKIFTCQADNGFGITTHDAVILDVHFAPVIEVSAETIEIAEGETLYLEATAKGNPDPLTYVWRRGAEVVMSANVINITHASREHEGIYTIGVSNPVGTAYKNVTVVIKSAPIITEIVSKNEINPGSKVALECHFQGSPPPEVEWKRQGYDMGRTETVSYRGKSLLIIRNVTSSDTGSFECHLKNEVGEATMPNVQLVVNQKPEADDSPQFKKAAADLGGTARLVCRVRGSPEVHFTWSTRDHELINTDIHPRYEIQPAILADNLYTYESVLVVKDVKTRDHGYFICQARNQLGIITTHIHLEGTTRPDPPLEFKVINVTHDSVHLIWTPGFDGGMQQTFRIRYHLLDSPHYLYIDSYPPNATEFWLGDLDLGSTYTFKVLAINSKGESDYSEHIVRATTLSEAPPMEYIPPGGPKRRGRVPSLVIVIITLVGAALLVLNVALVTCFIRRKARKRKAGKTKGSPPLSEMERAITRVLADKTNLPRVVTLAVSTIGGLLVLVNVALVGCVLHKRKSRTKESPASSDKGSSKSTTIEMYAPSSYTGTVTGETLSSISEKSRESYTNEDSADEYEVDAGRVTVASTYLIEQLEPPPQYASRAAAHVIQSQTHGELNMDDPYADNLRRNQYNASLGQVPPGYGTLGRRGGHPAVVQDSYGVVSSEGYPSQVLRYNSYLPTANHILPQGHTAYPHYNGSLRRNPGNKLHFPKDYIRNGAMGTPGVLGIPENGDGSEMSFTEGGTPIQGQVSPTRTPPPLSTFSTDKVTTQSSFKSLPIEQRGHLV